MVAREALIALRERYKAAGAELEILGVGTTGYGEQLFAEALSAECHVVETVAHARARHQVHPRRHLPAGYRGPGHEGPSGWTGG